MARNNRFLNAVVTGAGCILGYNLMQGAIETVRNPVKRKQIKSGFANIKNAFKKSE